MPRRTGSSRWSDIEKLLPPFGASPHAGYRIRERRRAWSKAERSERRLRTISDDWKGLQSRTPEARAIGALRLKRAFRGTNSFQENEGVGEHVRTRSHAGLWRR